MKNETIVNKINKVREVYYTPIIKIAKDIDISRSYLSRILRGKTTEVVSDYIYKNLEEWLKSRKLK